MYLGGACINLMHVATRLLFVVFPIPYRKLPE